MTTRTVDRALLTRPESAERLGIGLRTLDRMIAEKVIPVYRIGNTRAVRIRRDDLDAALRKVD